MLRNFSAAAVLLVCGGINMAVANAPAAQDIDLDAWCGTWYEIARTPNKHQSGTVDVTHSFKALDNGRYSLVTTGFKGGSRGKKQTLQGEILVNDKRKSGSLKVRLFRFLTVEYKIVDVDKINYRYALVTSGSGNHVWIFSRTPVMDEAYYNKMLESARQKGFDVEKLEMVAHNRNAGAGCAMKG
ncbi:MAG: lipocalin family protein [Chitinispirillales bacterium]|jgi:apolipoprotein D and lipocalin family protein|nr:lipocalin family protein [Chitinispirillales bacterium]